MTSVAYSEQPPLPGALTTTLALVMGWISAAAALGLLYISAWAVGAISQPSATEAGVINEWPYYGGGAWSLFANIAVLFIGLVLATVATSWWLRRTHEHVSDGRLAILLLLTGGIPLVISHHDHHGFGLLGFILAVVFVRRWVVRREGRWALVPTLALLTVLCAVVLSYGLLHPLWTTTDAFRTGADPRQCAVGMNIHNAALVGVTLDQVEPPPGFTIESVPDDFAARSDAAVSLLPLGGGSGTGVFDVTVRYSVFGFALTERLPLRIQLQNNC